jgi:hypothetical protein
MCKLVAHAREAEKKQDHQLTKLKIDLFCLRNETLFFTTPPHEFEFASITLSRALSTSPPTPPPRSA